MINRPQFRLENININFHLVSNILSVLKIRKDNIICSDRTFSNECYCDSDNESLSSENLCEKYSFLDNLHIEK